MVFRTLCGPIHKAFCVVAPSVRAALERNMLAPLDELNAGGADLWVVPSEYLEVVITRV